MQATKRVKRDLSLRDVLGVLRRQRFAVVAVFVLCLGAGAVAFKTTRGAWRTSLRILLVDAPTVASSSNDPLEKAPLPSSVGSISTQIQIIEGGEILKRLGYGNEYDPFAPKIQAQQIGETNVLTLSVEAADPATPSSVAAHLGPVYAGYMKVLQDTYITNGLAYLSGRVAKYEDEYKKALAALQAAKAKRALPALEGEGGVRSGRVTATNSEVEAREADVAAAEKTLAVLEAQQRNLPTKGNVKSIQSNRGEIEGQMAAIESLKTQRASLATQWKEGTYRLVEIDAQIAEAKRRLLELPPIVDASSVTDDPLKNSLYSQIAGAKASLAATKVHLSKAESAAAQALSEFLAYSKVEPDQTKLATEVSEARSHLLESEQTLDALNLKQNQSGDPVKILSSPSPVEKIRPLLPQYVVISLLAGMIFAVALALVKDHIEDRVTSPDEVFQLCGLEPLAQMPRMPLLSAPFSASTAIERHEPSAELFDSYRLLRFNLLNAAERGYMGSLVITSASGSEGKSDLAADLASVMAGSGRKVILVDANLRNPSVATRFGLAERPGMTDVLIGEVPLEAALVPTNVEGLHVLPAGAKTTNPVDLLESSQMVSMHTSLRELADLVIFDAPSCLAFADVSVLASFTDSVLVVAELGTTKRDLLNRGVSLLQRSSARLVGVVLRESQPGRKRGRRKAAA